MICPPRSVVFEVEKSEMQELSRFAQLKATRLILIKLCEGSFFPHMIKL